MPEIHFSFDPLIENTLKAVEPSRVRFLRESADGFTFVVSPAVHRASDYDHSYKARKKNEKIDNLIYTHQRVTHGIIDDLVDGGMDIAVDKGYLDMPFHPTAQVRNAVNKAAKPLVKRFIDAFPEAAGDGLYTAAAIGLVGVQFSIWLPENAFKGPAKKLFEKAEGNFTRNVLASIRKATSASSWPKRK